MGHVGDIFIRKWPKFVQKGKEKQRQNDKKIGSGSKMVTFKALGIRKMFLKYEHLLGNMHAWIMERFKLKLWAKVD